MSWIVIGLVLIVYPLFGVAIYLIRNKLTNIRNFNVIVFAPAVISFVLGLGFMAYALASN